MDTKMLMNRFGGKKVLLDEKGRPQITVLILKPGFTKDEMIIETCQRAEREKLSLVDCSFVTYTKEAAGEHYCNKIKEPYYPELEGYMTSGKSFVMIFSGENAISKGRTMIGATEGGPQKGSIRYDYPIMFNLEIDKTRNVIHASDSIENALSEAKIYKKLDKSQSKSKDKNEGIEL